MDENTAEPQLKEKWKPGFSIVFVFVFVFNKTEYPTFCFVFEIVNQASQSGLMNALYSYLSGPTSWVLGLQACSTTWHVWCWGLTQDILHTRQALYQLSSSPALVAGVRGLYGTAVFHPEVSFASPSPRSYMAQSRTEADLCLIVSLGWESATTDQFCLWAGEGTLRFSVLFVDLSSRLNFEWRPYGVWGDPYLWHPEDLPSRAEEIRRES